MEILKDVVLDVPGDLQTLMYEIHSEISKNWEEGWLFSMEISISGENCSLGDLLPDETSRD